MREIHAALVLAQVLHARHDLLPRITAFLEIHSTDEVEVRHLRYELLLRLRQDDGDAGTDVEPVPAGRTGRCGIGAEFLPQCGSLLCRDIDLEAVCSKANQACVILLYDVEPSDVRPISPTMRPAGISRITFLSATWFP